MSDFLRQRFPELEAITIRDTLYKQVHSISAGHCSGVVGCRQNGHSERGVSVYCGFGYLDLSNKEISDHLSSCHSYCVV